MEQRTMTQLGHAIQTVENIQRNMREWRIQHMFDHLAQLKGELEWIRDQEKKAEKERRQ